MLEKDEIGASVLVPRNCLMFRENTLVLMNGWWANELAARHCRLRVAILLLMDRRI